MLASRRPTVKERSICMEMSYLTKDQSANSQDLRFSASLVTVQWSDSTIRMRLGVYTASSSNSSFRPQAGLLKSRATKFVASFIHPEGILR